MALSTKCMVSANDTGFQRRVKYFMQKGAQAIIGEPGATAGHAERKAYADKVLDGSASVYEMSVAVTTNSTIAANIDADTEPTDNDMEFTVNSLINDFAGYEA